MELALVALAAVVLIALVAGVACVVSSRARRRAEERATQSAAAMRLLRTVLDAAPAATVLLGDNGEVLLTNEPARRMFAEGAELEGENFLGLLENAPPAFREALVGEEDALFTVAPSPAGGESSDGDTFRLTKRHLDVDEQKGMLLTVEPITREIRRKEVEVWKKLLRTLSHEINNSLAPITSLVHSARLMAGRPEHEPKLARVFDTIDDRARHLTEFLEGFARFARLPRPRPQKVPWRELVERLGEIYPDARLVAPEHGEGWLDPAQIEQVLLNLLKNAVESGSAQADIELEVVTRDDGHADLVVRDRGSGMTDEVLASALLPFYSTKERGSGLGLALCREIIESHGGKLRLQNREGGGLAVVCSLPPRDPSPARETAKITLTHG